jgi:hypothetical protein
MRKRILLFILASGVAAAGYSQHGFEKESSYQTAIGLRLGSGYFDVIAASLKTFLRETPGALELNLGLQPTTHDWTNLSFSVSYQYHFDIEAVNGLKWFVGGGFIAYNTFSNNDQYGGGFGFGLFPAGGLDYKFENIPLNLTADIRPTFSLVHPNDYYPEFYPNIGISARYTLR